MKRTNEKSCGFTDVEAAIGNGIAALVMASLGVAEIACAGQGYAGEHLFWAMLCAVVATVAATDKNGGMSAWTMGKELWKHMKERGKKRWMKE